MDVVLAGVIVAIVSVALARVVDAVVARHRRWRRECAVLLAVREELDANRDVMESNRLMAEQELA